MSNEIYNSEAPSGSETILLVEDDDAVRTMIREFLESKGYTVLEARNGDEAIQTSEQHQAPIHLLVTDVVMPGMNVRELVQRLEPRCPEMKVIHISGYISERTILGKGICFLRKPFRLETLADKVREILEVGKKR